MRRASARTFALAPRNCQSNTTFVAVRCRDNCFPIGDRRSKHARCTEAVHVSGRCCCAHPSLRTLKVTQTEAKEFEALIRSSHGSALEKSRSGNHLQMARCKWLFANGTLQMARQGGSRSRTRIRGQHPLPAPGWRFSKDSWSSFVPGGSPIVNDLNCIQSEPVIRVVTEVSIAF